MKRRIIIGLLCFVAVVAWTGLVDAQTAKPGTLKTIKLSSGEEVYDLNGDWDAFVENYGEQARFGIYSQVFRITQTGNTFEAIRLKNNPPPSPGRAGSPCLRGELGTNGFQAVGMISGGGELRPSKGQISEDGKRIVIDSGMNKVTLTRSEDRTPLVGMWRLLTFQLEYQATGEREYPMGMAPTGYLLFLPEGRMSVVITGEGRKAPATDQDRAGLFSSLVAYTGPYRVDGDKWITTVEVSANPASVATEQVRMFQISGDRLQEATAWLSRPDNRMARFVITYERVK